MKRGQSAVAFLRSPVWMSSLAAFMLVWGLLAGGIVHVLLAACLFYLAWNTKRSQPRVHKGEGPGSSADASARPKQLHVSRLVFMSISIGAVIGGIQAYTRFLGFGLPKVFAAGLAFVIAVGVSLGSWFLVRRVMKHSD